MARPILFAREFMKDHPRAGVPTRFEWKILTGRKIHTIRKGDRWREEEKFSPRVWTGKPYRSKQREIRRPLTIRKIYEIMILDQHIYLDEELYCNLHSGGAEEIAENDGLDHDDFVAWFKPYLPFEGQMICWEEVEY